jgi:hypothetical protein
MKNINFVNALSPHEQRKIAGWYRHAIIGCVVLAGSMIGVHVWQLYRLLHMRKTYAALQHNAPKYSKEADEYAHMAKQYEQLNTYAKQCAIVRQQFQHCVQNVTIPTTVQACSGIGLDAWKYAETMCAITMRSNTLQDGLTCVQKLRELPMVKTMTIVSMQASTADVAKTVTIVAQGTLHDCDGA